MGNTAWTTAVASLVATIITVGAGWLTRRAAVKATARSTDSASRTDLERDAFVRADAISAATMARLVAENRDQARKIDELEHKVDEQADEIADLRRQLAVLKPS